MRDGLVHEALEAAGLPELAGGGVGGIDRHLRRKQHGVDAGVGDLLRHQLAVAHVALQRRAVAVEEHHDHAGLLHVEILGDVHQHAVVVVGLVLPVDAAGIAAMAFPADIEERSLGSGIVAVIGEGGGFHADQRGQLVLLHRLLLLRQRQRRIERSNAVGLGLHRAPRCEVGHLALLEAFIRAREAIAELRLREAIVEAVAGRGGCIGRKRGRARCATALGEEQRERNDGGGNGEPAKGRARAAPMRDRLRRSRIVSNSIRQVFRNSSEHPPPKVDPLPA